jgi:hypothetical protein
VLLEHCVCYRRYITQQLTYEQVFILLGLLLVPFVIQMHTEVFLVCRREVA